MKTVHLTNAYHPTSGGVRTLYSALLSTANRLRRSAALIVPAAEDGMERVGEFGRIYFVRARPAPFDPRYRLISPRRYLLEGRGSIRGILQAEQPDLIEICDKYSLFYLAGLIRREWLPGLRRSTLIGTSAERLDDNVAAFISSRRLAKRWSRWYMRAIYAPGFDYHVAKTAARRGWPPPTPVRLPRRSAGRSAIRSATRR